MKKESAEFAELYPLLQRFGVNSSSFVALYEGYRFFRVPEVEGCLPYLETPRAWIGAGEPIAPQENWGPLLRGFQTACRANGKVAMLLPAGEKGRELAQAEGFGALKIGAEPVFQLDRYQPALDTVTTARRLYDRGARVDEFRPEKLPAGERAELDEIMGQWLASRKMDPLGFLNRVEPWTYLAQKKYFRTRLNGRTVAFVAAVPIPARQGWYLIDILRRDGSPPGSTELLILEASRLLQAQGARVVTLGMAPLAELGQGERSPYPRLTALMRFGFQYGGMTYNFKSLHQFKMKFQPTRSEPCYLLYFPAKLGLRNVRGLIEATVGSSQRALGSALRKRLQRLDWLGSIESRLARDFVLRPTPSRLREVIARMPFTLAIFCLLTTVYFFREGELSPIVGEHLLHGSPGHLASNLLLLWLGVGTLEYFRGTSFTFAIYGLCALSSNPLTEGLFWPMRWLAPELWESVRGTAEIGASLGIFGCVGSLVTILRQQRWVLSVLGAFYFAFAAFTGNALALSHVTALCLGAAIETIL